MSKDIMLSEIAMLESFFEKPEGKDTVYALVFSEDRNKHTIIDRKNVKCKSLSASGHYFCFQSLDQILFVAHMMQSLKKEQSECICN